MKRTLFNHLIQRSKQRKISKTDIYETVRNPDKIEQGSSGRELCIKKLNGDKLVVVIERTKNKTKFITTFVRKQL